jgi:hypothetical protein
MAGRPNSVSAAPDFGVMMADSAVPPPEEMELGMEEGEAEEESAILDEILAKLGGSITADEFREAVKIAMK